MKPDRTTSPGTPTTSAGAPGLSRLISPRSGLPSGRVWVASLLVGLATLFVMLASEPRLAIVWDEGYTLGREARLRLWFRALRDPSAFAAAWEPPPIELVQQVPWLPPPRRDQVDSRRQLLTDPAVLGWFWPFAREEPHGHPPFYALLGLVGDVVAPGLADLPRGRVGPILLFSLCAGAVFRFVAVRWGGWAAAVAAGAWALQPNLFGHGHYAAYDGVLSSLWLLAIFAFVAAIERDDAPAELGARPRRGLVSGPTVLLGVILGCAMADKLTGWFIPIPLLAWAAWERSRRALGIVVVAGLIGLVALYALIPPWWVEPIAGPLRFFRSNLTRGETIPIPVMFLGRIYQTPRESLPWYNTLAWTALVTPVGFLLMALLGAIGAVARRRAEPAGLLILANWLFLMALRSTPHTPGHDGVRLFLPAFGVLALLAGLGAAWIGGRLPKLAWGLAGVGLVEGAASILLMMPTPLAYFSPIVGGLPGAARMGMEPTYYWDGLDADALAWLRAHTPPGRTIHFSTFPTSWLYLRDAGLLPRQIVPVDPGVPAWYVVQNRPGAWSPTDRDLVAHAKPAYVVSRMGVPLVWIFPHPSLAPR